MAKSLDKIKDTGITFLGGGILASLFLGIVVASIPVSIYNYITKNHRSTKNPDKIKLPREVKSIAKKLNKNGQVEVRFELLEKKAWNFEAYRAYNVNYSQNGETVNLARAVVRGGNQDEFLFPTYGWHYEISAFFPTTKTLFLKVPKSVDIRYDINLERQVLSRLASEIGINTKLLQSEGLAHRAALSIASQIADYSHLPLVDHSKEDRANLEAKFRES